MGPCSTRFHHLRGFSGNWWSGLCEGSWWSATLLYPVYVLIGVHWWCTSSLTLQEEEGVDMKKSRDHSNEWDISLSLYLSIYLSMFPSFQSVAGNSTKHERGAAFLLLIAISCSMLISIFCSDFFRPIFIIIQLLQTNQALGVSVSDTVNSAHCFLQWTQFHDFN